MKSPLRTPNVVIVNNFATVVVVCVIKEPLYNTRLPLEACHCLSSRTTMLAQPLAFLLADKPLSELYFVWVFVPFCMYFLGITHVLTLVLYYRSTTAQLIERVGNWTNLWRFEDSTLDHDRGNRHRHNKVITVLQNTVNIRSWPWWIHHNHSAPFREICLRSYIWVSRLFKNIIFIFILVFYDFERTLRAFESWRAWRTPLRQIVIIVPNYLFVYVYSL